MCASDIIKLWNTRLLVKHLKLNKREKERKKNYKWVRTDKLFIRCLRDGPSRLRSVNSPDLVVGPLFESGQGKLAILTTASRALPQFLHANTGVKLCYLD
jgi:hypothetical protein